MSKKRQAKYKKELPRLLYTYFISYAEGGAPSFQKFARSIGVTLADIQSFRSHGEFERAYQECSEIRRDYLIDNALGKRIDPTFTKFILGYEFGMSEKENGREDKQLEVRLEVIEN